MLSYREVMYVVSAAKTGSFARAAEACHISQPSLSIQIKKIEERLDCPIFVRSVQGVQLTPFGRDILPKLEAILAQFDDIQLSANQAKQRQKVSLKLGIISTIGPYLLPKLQDISGIDFTEGTTDILLQKLLINELDGAILALPIKLPNLKSTKLLRDAFYLVAATQNQHVSKIDMKTMTLPEECTFLVLSEEHCLGEQTAELCQLQRSHVSKAFQATSLETIRQMVAQSNNVTLMPAMAKRQGDGLAYYDLAPKFYRDIGIVYKKSSPRRAEISVLEQTLSGLCAR